MNFKTLLIATVLAASPAAFAGDAAAGKKKSEPCKACHGENGVSATGDFPIIAGQPQDYLKHALSHYKSGKRKNPIMQGQVANLTPRDIDDLSAYFASQKALTVKY